VEVPSWVWPAFLGLFGLLWGSFANVVIWRLPRGESVVSPGSHCPSCDMPIRWYDNLPVLAWLLLRGRCRDCGEPISIRYPLVELFSGALWFSAGARFGFSVQTVTCVLFFYLLLLLSFIDLDTYRLPNNLVGALAVIGLAGALSTQLTGTPVAPLVGTGPSGLLGSPLATSAIGGVLGAGLSWGIAAIYGRVRGTAGLGMGDVKLLGAMGFFLGPYVVMSLFLGSLVGAVAGLLQARGAGEALSSRRIPFGPFLALGAVVSVLAGPALWGWYAALVGIA
jgi:leader peptidase (prepilin peptidase)/N-methyltransferase